MTPHAASIGDWTTEAGSEENDQTPLYPFRYDASTPGKGWYTSEDVRRTEKFGYTYPETAGLTYPTTDAGKAAVKAAIDRDYIPINKMVRQSIVKDPSAGAHLLPQAALLKHFSGQSLVANSAETMRLATKLPGTQTLLMRSLDPSKPVVRNIAPQNKYLEWLVNLKAERHALSGSFSVHIFLDAVQEEEVYLWPLSPVRIPTCMIPYPLSNKS